MTYQPKLPPHLVFDWGDTLMADLPGQDGPMHSWPEVKLMPAVADVIPRLATQHTLSIATNAETSNAEDVRKALARAGIDAHFGRIFTAVDLGFGKQDARFWPEVCAQLGAKPEQVCMIGDNLEVDILPALRAGTEAIWYLRTQNEAVTMPHFLSVRTLRELLTQYS